MALYARIEVINEKGGIVAIKVATLPPLFEKERKGLVMDSAPTCLSEAGAKAYETACDLLAGNLTFVAIPAVGVKPEQPEISATRSPRGGQDG